MKYENAQNQRTQKFLALRAIQESKFLENRNNAQ